MPKYHEKQRKIKLLESGENVRPPKKWWDKMLPMIKNTYPMYSQNELYNVLGGIWNKYDMETKLRIINEYQTDNNSMSFRQIHKEELGRLR